MDPFAGQAVSYGATPVEPAPHLILRGQQTRGTLVSMVTGFRLLTSTLPHAAADVVRQEEPRTWQIETFINATRLLRPFGWFGR